MFCHKSFTLMTRLPFKDTIKHQITLHYMQNNESQQCEKLEKKENMIHSNKHFFRVSLFIIQYLPLWIMAHCFGSEVKSFNFSFFFLIWTENINKSEIKPNFSHLWFYNWDRVAARCLNGIHFWTHELWAIRHEPVVLLYIIFVSVTTYAIVFLSRVSHFSFYCWCW